MFSQLIAIFLLISPFASAAQGACILIIAPHTNDLYRIKARVFVYPRNPPEFAAIIDENGFPGDEVIARYHHFYDVSENSIAEAQIMVNDIASHYFSTGSVLFNSQHRSAYYQAFTLHLKCAIINPTERNKIGWVGNESRLVTNYCPILSKRGASSIFAKCSDVCVQCITFYGPKTSETYMVQFPNKDTEIIKGRNIVRKFCYYLNKAVPNELKIQRMVKNWVFGQKFSTATTLRLKLKTNQVTQELGTYMTTQC